MNEEEHRTPPTFEESVIAIRQAVGEMSWETDERGMKWAVVEREDEIEVFGDHPTLIPGRHPLTDGRLSPSSMKETP